MSRKWPKPGFCVLRARSAAVDCHLAVLQHCGGNRISVVHFSYKYSEVPIISRSHKYRARIFTIFCVFLYSWVERTKCIKIQNFTWKTFNSYQLRYLYFIYFILLCVPRLLTLQKTLISFSKNRTLFKCAWKMYLNSLQLFYVFFFQFIHFANRTNCSCFAYFFSWKFLYQLIPQNECIWVYAPWLASNTNIFLWYIGVILEF